jgi:hypothetical protein
MLPTASIVNGINYLAADTFLYILLHNVRSCGSVVCRVTKLLAGIVVSLPVGVRDFCFHSCVQDGCEAFQVCNDKFVPIDDIKTHGDVEV